MQYKVEGEGRQVGDRTSGHGRDAPTGLAIYRFGAALFYANAGRFSEGIHELVGATPSKCAGW